MRHRLGIFALLGIASVLAATAAQGETRIEKQLVVKLDGGFSPHSLPRSRPAPVTMEIEGSIGTTDGSRPPALRRFEIALNRHGRLYNRGLATCKSGALQSVSSEAALKRCRPALVGQGRFAASVESNPATIPARGRILAFNASRGGKPELLLHLYGTTPIRASFVLPLVIEHRGTGQLSTVLAANVPSLAGGLGSITMLKLKIGRTFSVDGKRHSYLSASCSLPAGFNRFPFTLARGTFLFRNGQQLAVPMERSCRVRE